MYLNSRFGVSFSVRFRAIPINTALKAFDDAVDVYMLDPRGNVVRRWLSRTVRRKKFIYMLVLH